MADRGHGRGSTAPRPRTRRRRVPRASGDEPIRDATETGGIIVCAWGARGGYLGRDAAMLRLIRSAGGVPYCQAQAEGLVLVTRDARIPLYGVRTMAA